MLTQPKPDFPIVDAHHHLWDLERNSYPWLWSDEPSIVGDPAPIRRTYMPADYLEDLRPFRLLGSVHLDGGYDPSDPVGETTFVHALASRHGFPNAIVGGVALDAEDAQATIEAHLSASPLVRGVRQIVAWHSERRLSYVATPDMMDGSLWRRNFALLRRHDLSFDLQLYPSQMAAAARLAGEHDETPIVLNQAGMPAGFEHGVPGDWLAGMSALAARPNVSVKVSGLGMLYPAWTEAQAATIIRATLDLFGADRVMFASNYPVDKLFRPLARIVESFEAAVGGLSDTERRKVFAANARRIYRMQIPDPLQIEGQTR